MAVLSRCAVTAASSASTSPSGRFCAIEDRCSHDDGPLCEALSASDGEAYEAAVALRATRRRIFTSVTLPGARYGLISATFVVFTMVITDFGAPKVIGGQYNVLATDIYKQVIGQQNFQMGAVVSTILLVPAALAFFVDRMARRRQVALLSIRLSTEPQIMLANSQTTSPRWLLTRMS